MRSIGWVVAAWFVLGLVGGCCDSCKTCQVEPAQCKAPCACACKQEACAHKESERKKCKDKDSWNPTEQYPEWAFDAPFYYKPASNRGNVATAVEPKTKGGPTHYYTREKMIFLPRPKLKPTDKQPLPDMPPRTTEMELAPRVAVHWTDTNGVDWERAGYFGVGQTHYAFPVDDDGVYGFRFVGPTLPPAKCCPPRPEVVYHVDTAPPCVTVYIEPNQPSYGVNDPITIHWLAHDSELVESSVSISACWCRPGCTATEWTPIEYEQPTDGTMTFVVPPHGSGCRLRIRADARDRAGNLGVGFSKPLQIQDGGAEQPAAVGMLLERITAVLSDLRPRYAANPLAGVEHVCLMPRRAAMSETQFGPDIP